MYCHLWLILLLLHTHPFSYHCCLPFALFFFFFYVFLFIPFSLFFFFFLPFLFFSSFFLTFSFPVFLFFFSYPLFFFFPLLFFLTSYQIFLFCFSHYFFSVFSCSFFLPFLGLPFLLKEWTALCKYAGLSETRWARSCDQWLSWAEVSQCSWWDVKILDLAVSVSERGRFAAWCSRFVPVKGQKDRHLTQSGI